MCVRVTSTRFANKTFIFGLLWDYALTHWTAILHEYTHTKKLIFYEKESPFSSAIQMVWEFKDVGAWNQPTNKS